MVTNVDGWYQLDTGWGCGGVLFIDEKIKACAPIFKKLLGTHFDKIAISYKLTKLSMEVNDE